MMTNFECITYEDIPAISSLQPDGWTDIQTAFRFYLSTTFCHPIKFSTENQIAGVGNIICFGQTAWLSHIIVSKDFRNKGIGLTIVKKLLKMAEDMDINSISLFATAMGEPVYLKAGFEKVCEYKLLKPTDDRKIFKISENIIPFEDKYYQQLIQLDGNASGENRMKIIDLQLNNCMIYIENNKLLGYYLPELGEGHIIAINSLIGIELMKLKCTVANKMIIPELNSEAVNFLLQNGFSINGIQGKRMIYGKPIAWKPEFIFNRIGGNLG